MKFKFFKILKRMTFIVLTLIAVLVVATIVYMKQPTFGKTVSKDQIEQLNKLSNFENGKFQNIEFTPELSEGYSTLGILYDFLFKKPPRRIPIDTIPSIITN